MPNKNILGSYQKQREKKEEQTNLMRCPKCGIPMVDNTFMHGSRIAGSASCKKCKCKIIF